MTLVQRLRRLDLLMPTLFATAVGLSVWAAFHPRLPGDLAWATLVQDLPPAWFEEYMEIASYVGKSWPLGLMVGFAAGVALLKGHRRLAVAFFAVWAATGLSAIIKEIIERPRPSSALVSVDGHFGGFSFPSGHALSAMLIFGFLAYIVPLVVKRRALGLAIQAALGLLIASIGLSRVYLGAHWPSDVLAGYVIGALCLILFLRFSRRWLERGLRRPPAPGGRPV